MTCIVGLEHPEGVTIGGDSAAVDTGDLSLVVRTDPKVFRRGPFLIGFTTSFRIGQALQYRLQVPDPGQGSDDEYMAVAFIDAVRQCLKDAGVAKRENEVEQGGEFLVGYRGKLYYIGDDYQVGRSKDGYMAVGCAAEVALGAMHAVHSTDAELADMRIPASRKVVMALDAAERFSGGVRRPFLVETLHYRLDNV